ncbi:hypothetical protein [Aeromonas veronii]|uniref:hypothetical protein n=1 Tax=Aeromonas TaxID=642 RepID=UPI0032EF7459
MVNILYIALAWLLLALSSLLPAHQAFAASTPIPAGLPQKQCSGDLTRNVTAVVDTGDNGQDVGSGVIYKNNFNTGTQSTVVCNCPDPYNFSGVTYSAYYTLPDNGQNGNIWAILNESLHLQCAGRGQPAVAVRAFLFL